MMFECVSPTPFLSRVSSSASGKALPRTIPAQSQMPAKIRGSVFMNAHPWSLTKVTYRAERSLSFRASFRSRTRTRREARPSGALDQSRPDSAILIPEDGHRATHTPESHPLVEPLGAWLCAQDDLLVTSQEFSEFYRD